MANGVAVGQELSLDELEALNQGDQPDIQAGQELSLEELEGLAPAAPVEDIPIEEEGSQFEQQRPFDLAEETIQSGLEGVTAGLSEDLVLRSRAAGRAEEQVVQEFGITPEIRQLLSEMREPDVRRALQQLPETSPAKLRFEELKNKFLGEEIQQRGAFKEQRPGLDIPAQIAGVISPVGPAAAAGRAGLAAGKAVTAGIRGAAPGVARGLAASGAGAATTAGVSGGLFQAGREVGVPEELRAGELGVGEAAGVSALLGPAASTLTRGVGAATKFGVNTVSKGAKKLLSAVGGVPEEVIDKYVQNIDKARNASDLDEVLDAVNEALNTAKSSELNKVNKFASESVQGLEKLKQMVIKGSDDALDVLEKDLKDQGIAAFSKAEIKGVIQNAARNERLLVEGVPVAGAERAMNTLAKLEGQIDNLPDEISGTGAKRLIKLLDKEISGLVTPGQFEDNLSQLAIKDVRSNLNILLRQKSTQYAEAMNQVAADTQLLSRSTKLLPNEEGSLRALKQITKPDGVFKKDKIEQFAKRVGVDIETALDAQANLDAFKTWNTGTIQAKVKQFILGNNVNTRNLMRKLSQMSDTELIDTIDNFALNEAFNKEFIRGSRNVNLWTFLGVLGGAGTNSSNAVKGGLMGVTIGTIMDKWGPAVTKQILNLTANSKVITRQAIRKFPLPNAVKDDLERKFVQSVLTGAREPLGKIELTTEEIPFIRDSIQNSAILNDSEKAKMISDMNKTGEVDSDAMIKFLTSGEEVELPTEIPQFIEERREKKNQPAQRLDSPDDSQEFKRQEKF